MLRMDTLELSLLDGMHACCVCMCGWVGVGDH